MIPTRKRFPTTVLCAALLVMAAMFAGATSLAPSSTARSEPARAEPSLVLSAEYESFGKRPSGPIILVWDDGMVVFAINPEQPGKELQTGTLTAEQVRAVIDELKVSGFFEEQMKLGQMPDNSCTTISAGREGKYIAHKWNEVLSRPWGAHVGADPAYKKFVKMWVFSRSALAFACPSEYQPLSKVPAAAARVRSLGSWRAGPGKGN